MLFGFLLFRRSLCIHELHETMPVQCEIRVHVAVLVSVDRSPVRLKLHETMSLSLLKSGSTLYLNFESIFLLKLRFSSFCGSTWDFLC